jgi:hypothetical protein
MLCPATALHLNRSDTFQLNRFSFHAGFESPPFQDFSHPDRSYN